MPEKIIRIMTFSQYDAHSKPPVYEITYFGFTETDYSKNSSVQLLTVPVSNLFIKK